MKEYGELEKQLKKLSIDLEKREKQLNVKEQEVNDSIISHFLHVLFHRFNVCTLILNVNLIINILKCVKLQNVYKNNLNIR